MDAAYWRSLMASCFGIESRVGLSLPDPNERYERTPVPVEGQPDPKPERVVVINLYGNDENERT